jgi:hypothetical protein
MVSTHSCIPSISPCPWRCTLWLVNYHMTFLPLMPVLEEGNSLVCAVEKGTRLGFVNILFRLRFVVGWRGQGCPRSQAIWGKNGCDTRTYFSVCIILSISLWPSSWVCVLLNAGWMPRKRVNKMGQVSICTDWLIWLALHWCQDYVYYCFFVYLHYIILLNLVIVSWRPSCISCIPPL